MCSRGAIQRAAAMQVTRCAHTSSDTKATMSVHQTSYDPPSDSPFRSRSYATFVTDQELQQARAEMEECYRRRARRAGLEDTLPVGRPMTEEEIEDLQWQLGDFGPASGYGSRGKKRSQQEVIDMTIEEMEAEIQETNEAIRNRRRRGLGLMLKPLWMLTVLACFTGSPAAAFIAYDCSNRSNVVESFSLLEPDVSANMGRDGEVETTVYGEIVQIKQDRMIPVFRCTVIETLVAHYCGMFSAAGVTQYLKFRELKPLEAWECRKARKNGQLLINVRPISGRIGATVSHTMFLAGDLDDDSNCEVGTVTLRNGKVLGGMASQGLYEITLREEFARMNKLTGSLTLTSGIQARAADKSIADSLEGTVVWEYDPMECPQTIVKLYKGMMKAYVNQTSTYEGSTVVVEHQDKDQAAGLEVAESFIVCGHQAFRTHIKNIAVFVHKDNRMEVAQGHFSGKEGEADLTRLESGMSFMQVRASMSMKEKLRQVRGAICENRRDIARTRLEAIAGADNPYSLISIFGRGHLAIKAGGAVYVTKCSPVEVVPRIHTNCTEEIPITINGTDAFVDPISCVIKSAGSPYTVTMSPRQDTRSAGSGTVVTQN
jgi:hypothetical protein